MRIFTSLALLGLALVCSCSTGKHYVRGQGDVGQFILQHAVTFGGHPIATNGLPTIAGDWQYLQDEYGIGILLSKSQYPPVQDFVRAAFGPPSNSAGWKARDFGVAIMVQKADTNTVVGIYPPMSDEKFARGILQTIEKRHTMMTNPFTGAIAGHAVHPLSRSTSLARRGSVQSR